MSRLSRREFLKAGAGLTTAAGLAGFYALFVERYLIKANHYTIVLDRLPPAFDGFTILQLTDLHYGFLMPLWLIERVIFQANHTEKDITVCTGDYVHERNSHQAIDEIWPVMHRLRAPLGVYSVLGNHDNWADPERSSYWLQHSGQNLRQKVRLFERDGQRLWLGGTGDLWTEHPVIDEVFAGVPWNDCKILLAHNPDTADRSFRTEIDLMISGHTHGGQVRLPLVGAPVLPVENKRYSSGLIDTPRLKLFISRGIGWTGYPVRVNCPPEIAVLTLRSAK